MFENLELTFAKLFFTSKKRIRVYRKLNRFLSNGVPLPRALDILWTHASDDGRKPKEGLALIIDHWRREVDEGRKLGQAISGWVPESDRLVIEGGEKAGNLTVAIEKTILISQSSQKIKMTLLKGLSYPVMLLTAALGLLIFIVRQVVPSFDQVLPRDQWEGLGAQMAFVASLIDNYLIFGLGFIVAIIALVTYSLPRWTHPIRVRFDSIPPWSLYRLVMGSSFMITVAGMLKAGIAQPVVLEMLTQNARPWYKQRVSHTLRWVNEGMNLGDALHKTGYKFPDKESVMDLRAYAGLNKFDEALDKLGTEWLEDSVEKIEIQTGFLKNLSFLVIGLTFGWIYGGILSLQQQITTTLQ